MYYRKILRQYLVQKNIRESMLQNYTCKTSKQPHAFEGKICPVTPIGIYLYGDLVSPFLKE